ncbi:hypothetical protein TNCV_4421411 [Trichonephila clavipes]|nr:hypothetical protein TNCV_4421411 [Trichonephila clavipes]
MYTTKKRQPHESMSPTCQSETVQSGGASCDKDNTAHVNSCYLWPPIYPDMNITGTHYNSCSEEISTILHSYRIVNCLQDSWCELVPKCLHKGIKSKCQLDNEVLLRVHRGLTQY